MRSHSAVSLVNLGCKFCKDLSFLKNNPLTKFPLFEKKYLLVVTH